MCCCLGIRKRRQPEPTTSGTHGLTGGGLSNPHQEQENEEVPGTKDSPKDVPSSPDSATHAAKEEDTVITSMKSICEDLSSPYQEQGNAEAPGTDSEDRPKDVLSPPDSAAHANEKEEIVITGIRATSLALGLRRIPAGFHAMVHHSDLGYKTENVPVSANEDVVEWRGPIPIPFDLTATVSLTIHASFEFQPLLGDGEQLRELTITVNELLDHSGKDIPFIFSPKDGDVVSPCSSLLVTVRRQNCDSNNSASGILECHFLAKESGDQLEDITNQGHVALSRYRKHGQKEDLERATERFEHALDICPPNHPCRAAADSNTATAKFIHCRVYNANASFDIPLILYRNALDARLVGHPDRPFTLIQLAAVHLARFEKTWDEIDTAQAGVLLREAIALSSSDSHEKRAAIFMLRLHVGRTTSAVPVGEQSSVEQHPAPPLTDVDPWEFSEQLLHHFKNHGDLTDLQQAIAVLEASIGSISRWDDRYVGGLMNLGVALSYRFDRLGNLNDLEEAISRYQDAVALTPHGDPNKPRRLTNLGISFKTRFRRLGKISDLEDAILRQQDAVDLTLTGHPDNPACLHNLATSFLTRFQRLGQIRDLEEAISRQREAVDLTPDGHPDRSTCLRNLGIYFLTRFERLGEIRDLEEAMSRQQGAVDLTPDGHPFKSACLNDLGNSYLTRFERLGEISDLEEAISRQQDAVDLTPNDHPFKPTCLNNLGKSFVTRFQRLGEISDLEAAISMLQDTVELTPNGHPAQPGHLTNLGNSFMIRFERLGEVRDLEEAISRQQNAVDLTPNGHPDKPMYLHNLGTSFKTRFRRLGEISDLEEAISRQQDAVDLTPNYHPDKPGRLNNLGNSFLSRFQRFGEVRDLKGAISRQQDAVDLTPNSHPDKPACLNNLGNSFVTRFQRFGEISDLEEAISRHQDAVDLTPNGHPDKPARLTCLGNSFMIRFERLREIGDLEEAILRQQNAADLASNDHPVKPVYLNNLGVSFRTRFEFLGKISDLKEAILRQQDAVNLLPSGHPDKPACLDNLGTSFKTRFECLGEIRDLEQAISKQQDAVNLTPNSHAFKPGCLSNLGNSFLSRFQRFGEITDVEEAISRQQAAVDLTPNGHPDKPALLNNLGNSILARCMRIGEIASLEQAIIPLSLAACAPAGPVTVRFVASQQWIYCARFLRHESLLHAYSVAIDFLPHLAWIGLSLGHRYRELVRAAGMIRDAAAAALDSGLPEIAVEWLEQGRSVVWGELLQLRSSYEKLALAHPDHARRLRELSAALEHAGSTREKSLSQRSNDSMKSLQQEVDRHRKLAIERDTLLQDIRRLPGFERFLQHKEFSELRASVHSGPVVILNAAQARCDALIVLANVDHVIHVPLPNFTLDRSKQLETCLKKFVRDARDDRYGYPVEEEDVRAAQWKAILSSLWKCVVKPVLDALAFSVPGFYDGSRNSEPGHRVYDFVISSYIPTLSILVASSRSITTPSSDLRLLAVCQPPSDGHLPLPGVVTELEHIKAVIRNAPSTRTTLTESSVGTVEEVLTLMKESDWVHFACHGVQDDGNPTNSGLCLANERRLRISDIVSLSRSHGGLAFLSACQTAKGDKALSDEAIHIAAGMLFAGYGGVVGTMWSINDKIAPEVAKDVYEQLFHDNGTAIPDYREAARALHVAVGRLRAREKKVLFEHWLPFIHVGL